MNKIMSDTEENGVGIGTGTGESRRVSIKDIADTMKKDQQIEVVNAQLAAEHDESTLPAWARNRLYILRKRAEAAESEADAVYEEQERVDYGAFTAVMADDGWELQCDFFGNPSRWRHSRTGRIVQHTAAFDCYKVGRVTPIPF